MSFPLCMQDMQVLDMLSPVALDMADCFTLLQVYSINSKGLVQKQEQQWSISAFEALRQTFTPAFGK